ncbi:hypothetical protein [Catenulispora rubra]|uniref:restriction endonuclease-related protein n=1 Tax=Catenulispora rubra TaxID=280293 RepID=UPI0018925836
MSIWRYTTVPGPAELALYKALRTRGLDAQLWPGLDAFDLHVSADGGPAHVRQVQARAREGVHGRR